VGRGLASPLVSLLHSLLHDGQASRRRVEVRSGPVALRSPSRAIYREVVGRAGAPCGRRCERARARRGDRTSRLSGARHFGEARCTRMPDLQPLGRSRVRPVAPARPCTWSGTPTRGRRQRQERLGVDDLVRSRVPRERTRVDPHPDPHAVRSPSLARSSKTFRPRSLSREPLDAIEDRVCDGSGRGSSVV
jgi:hypothetical protein